MNVINVQANFKLDQFQFKSIKDQVHFNFGFVRLIPITQNFEVTSKFESLFSCPNEISSWVNFAMSKFSMPREPL